MNTRPLAAGLTVVGLVAASALGLAVSASADDAPPTDTTASVAPSSPPTEDTTTAPVADPSPTAAAEPTSSADHSDASLPTADATAPPLAARVAPTPTTYVIGLWSYDTEGVKFPQTLVTSASTTSTDVHALDASAAKCGTTYQSDLYADDAATATLIAAGHLTGGGESWPGGSYKAEFSNTFTTAPCPPPTAVCTTSTVDPSVWSTEDGAPTTGTEGITFSTPTPADKVNYFGPSSGQPLRGSTGSYTMTSTGGPQAAFDIEVWQTGTTGFATIVYEPYINGYALGGDGSVVTYTIGASSLVWNTKIATGPGSQSQPVTLSAMSDLIPNATVIRAGLGQGKNNAAAVSTVSSFTFDCATTTFSAPPVIIPDKPADLVTHDSSDVLDCTTTTVTTHHTTTTIGTTYDATSNSWVQDAPVTVNDADTTRAATVVECPVVIPPITTDTPVTPTASGSLAFTGEVQADSDARNALVLVGGSLALLGILGVLSVVVYRRRHPAE